MMGKSKKVFMVASLPPPYNGQNIGSLLVKQILEEDFELEVFRWNLKYYLTDNATISEKLFYYLKAVLKYIKVIFTLWLLFLLKRPEKLYIVPSSNLKSFLRDLMVYLPFLITNKRIICHIRSGSFQVNHNPFKWLYQKSNFKFIFLTQLLQKLSGVKSDNFKVISNFIDPIFDQFHPNPKDYKKRELDLPIRIVFLSNLFVSKGVFEIIDAVKNLNSTIPIELFIYGKGEENVINRIKEEIKTAQNIIFGGEISDREKVKSILADADLFALPTTYHVEASPRSILEAMSQGCVPLVTNHAGIPDMVNDKCSYLIDKNGDLVPKILEVLNTIDLNDLKTKKIEARNRFEEHYSFNNLKIEISDFVFNS